MRLLGGITNDSAGVLHVLEVGSPHIVDGGLAVLPPAFIHLDNADVHILTLLGISIGQRHTIIDLVEGDDVGGGHDHGAILVDDLSKSLTIVPIGTLMYKSSPSLP